MLRVLDEKIARTPEDIENEYRNCKYVLVNYGDIQNPKGFLYCVSDSKDSFREICEIADDIADKGIPCMLSGSYNNGGAIGVQYEM